MDIPCLSIVTPSYEQAAYLRENLESIHGQEYPDIEHVVVDGGSTDGTVEVLESFEQKTEDDEHYELRWVSEPDRGQSHAINKGIELATGEWIGWQNADDYYLPEAFEIFKDAIEKSPGVDLVYGDQSFVDAEGNEIRRRYHTRPSKFIQKHWRHFTANSCTFVRTSVMEDLGGVDEAFEYTMDAELFWRLLKADLECVHVPAFIGVRRMHDAAKTSSKDEQQYLWERESLYDYTRLEQRLPDDLLKVAAIGLKTVYLAREGRIEGIADMYRTLVEENIVPRRFRSAERNPF